MGAFVPPPGQPKSLQPGEFTPSASANVVTFRQQQVDLPSAIYIQRDDQLVIHGMTLLAGETLVIGWRLLEPNGVIQKGQQVLPFTGAGTFATATIPLSEGFLLSVTILPTVATTRGATFAGASISRAFLLPINPAQVLCSDTITQGYGTGWPGGRITPPMEGQGAPILQAVGGLPAQNFIFTIPAGLATFVRGFNAGITTDATAGNRLPQLFFQTSAGTTWAVADPNNSIPPSTTTTVHGSHVITAPVAGQTYVNVGLPTNLMLPGGSKIATGTQGFGPGDTWNTFNFYFEQLTQF